MSKILSILLSPLKKPGTRSGVNALAVVLGLYFGPAEVEIIVAAVGSLYALYDLVRRERDTQEATK